jgi:hypothetical protein
VRPFAIVVLAVLVSVLPARAGIYSPNEPFLFETDSDGFAKPIQFAGGFNLIRSELREVAILPQNPSDPLREGRKKALDQVKQLEAKGVGNLSNDEFSILTTGLIRLNDDRAATNVLQPRAARGGFMVYMHMARARAGQGDWQDAVERERIALSEFPTSYERLTKPQLTWLKKVERDYYLPFLSRRAQEASRGRTFSRIEEPDELFPTIPAPRKSENPVHFVGLEGTYVAGTIADVERKKLPPDAIAIIQQLVLWHPFDGRLYWLLGELYNADGDVETAFNILDECTNGMAITNETIKEHRRVLKSAAEAMARARAEQLAHIKQQEAEDLARQAEDHERQAKAERDYQRRFWWIVAVGVALGLLLVYYQFREVFRRLRRARGR